MMIDENDIIIKLRNALKAKKEGNITIVFTDWDSDFGLLAGSTKSYIKTVADGLGYDVEIEGASMIELTQRPLSQGRLTRG